MTKNKAATRLNRTPRAAAKPRALVPSRAPGAVRKPVSARAPAPKFSGIDQTDRLLLDELQDDARLSYAELGRRVHLSTPAVIERMRRLEAAGVILRYRAEIDPAALGLQVRAFVKVTVAGDRLANFSRIVRDVPEILECHRVTGNESFIVQVAVRDMNHLEEVIDSLMPYVATNTSMVLNSPVRSGRLSLHGAPGEQTARPVRRR